MTKLDKPGKLQMFLDEDLAPRKRELTTLKFLIEVDPKADRKHIQEFLLRVSVPILYSHWEGFIKKSAAAYLQFVATQGITLRQLQRNFVALAFRSKIFEGSVAKKVGMHIDVVEHILVSMDHALPVPYENIIKIEGNNLNIEALKIILETIGIPYSKTWEDKETWIDKSLLTIRNAIAHGEFMSVDLPTYQRLHNRVIESLDEFKTEIENAVAAQSYLIK